MATTNNFTGPFIGIFYTLLGWLNPKHWPGKYKPTGNKIVTDSIDLRPKLPPAFVQIGNACVANGVAGMAWLGHTPMSPDTIASTIAEIEHRARVYHGNPNQDSTVKPREGLWAAIDMGLASKSLRVANRRQDVMDAIANGYAVGMGLVAYNSFLAAGHTIGADGKVSGIVPMPTQADAKVGGHFGCLVGGNATHATFRNNGGPTWGDNGHAYFPWEFVENSTLTQDLWTLVP